MPPAPSPGAAGTPRRLRIATRGSPLARWQADHVAALLRAAHGEGLEVEILVVSTEGDRRTDVPIEEVGGRGVFVKEVQAAVLDGRADLAVHSAKDLPSAPELQPEGLVLAAVPEREDPRDALVGSTLADLPAGGLVATGSARRRAQLANLRPDLTFSGLRGNMATRLQKAADYDAIVVAAAALSRLERSDVVAEILEPAVMLPQVGQGALAVECREGDDATRRDLAAIEDATTRRAVDAERAFLAGLGGGCDLPVGALATVGAGGTVEVEGLLASFDGRLVLREVAGGDDPAAVGAALAERLLDGAGGRGLLLT
ncbi:MAG TPA: hydroxymethylbilane synthase [Acidimicrobiales bacterium]|nr:hydroxymethylbilane synthase [Acidimicrobiales bacterium]